MKAISQIMTHDNKKVIGYIQFNEMQNGTLITGVLDGLQKGEHGMHIHEKGDPTKCCAKLGDHYNPFKKNHGDRLSSERHVGDLGNITFDENQQCNFSFMDNQVKLTGPYSVIGRSIIIHANKDDLGLGGNDASKINGNSGDRIAYGIIGYA
jgi:Cu-Zn family superoxide dismutase